MDYNFNFNNLEQSSIYLPHEIDELLNHEDSNIKEITVKLLNTFNKFPITINGEIEDVS